MVKAKKQGYWSVCKRSVGSTKQRDLSSLSISLAISLSLGLSVCLSVCVCVCVCVYLFVRACMHVREGGGERAFSCMNLRACSVAGERKDERDVLSFY